MTFRAREHLVDPTISQASPPKPALSIAPNRESTHDAPSEVFRSDLLADVTHTDRLTVSYRGRDMHCDLQAGSRSIISGSWDWEFHVAGKTLDSSREWDGASWENNCWENNEEVAYSELQINLPSGLEIQRQMFLARRERFALMADVVIAPQDVEAEYRLRLPVSPDLRMVGATETREVTLWHDRRPIATVLPLSLPEWSRAPGGSLEHSDGLFMKQRFQGRRSHSALFVDLEPRRIRRQLTWRRLTVAESLNIVPPDSAVGYRVQIGKEQWLIYRSLGPRGNRSLLGQNFSTEFVVARFKPDGLAEKLLEIL